MNVYIGGPTSQQVTNYVPQMTADTQDGYTATCSTQLNNTFYAWDSFFVSTQGGTDHCFHSSNIGSGNRGWSQIQLPKGIIVNKIEIGARKNESSTNLRPIGAFSLKGSNDGITWTEIKAVSGLGSSWSIGSVQSWNITGQTTAYTYLKLEVQAYSSYVAFDYWNIDGVVEETKVVKNIYIGEYKWKPGSNTLLYLPIDNSDTASTVYDHSTNSKNNTWYGTASYDTLASGKRVLNLTGSNGIYVDYALFTSNPFTVNIYIYRDGNQNNDTTAFQNQSGTPKNGVVMAFFESTKITSFVGNNSNWQGLNNRESLSDTTWNNIVTTYDNGTIKMYINGVLKQSYSATVTYNNLLSASFGFTRNIGDYSNTRFLKGKMGSLIVENKTWTAQEVSDYYNNTKSNYGL